VGGSACGYFTDVALFGGPPSRRGCDQTVPPGSDRSASPSVTLPPGGSPTAVTATDPGGALAEYGPAVIFGGRPPADPEVPVPPCGPITVSTKGRRSITSTASVKNVGPGPFTAEAVRSTCHASKSGVSASTTITRGVLVTAADGDGNATASEPVPTHPPVNHTIGGTTQTGDRFKAVFNEQKVNRDGSITVDAVHIHLLGPMAKGDIVIARTSCKA